jgi:predicted ester cyclase
MTTSAEEHLVRRFYAEAWNGWDDGAADELLADDFQFRGSLGSELEGRGAWRAYRDRIRRAVPDFHNEVVDVVTAPDRAAARLRYTWHVRGALLGRLGYGREIAYDGAAFFHCSEGRLASAWVLGDLDRLHRQLGMEPLP